MSIESVMPSSHLILCCPLLLLPPILPSIRVSSNESALCMRWPKYWSFIRSSCLSVVLVLSLNHRQLGLSLWGGCIVLVFDLAAAARSESLSWNRAWGRGSPRAAGEGGQSEEAVPGPSVFPSGEPGVSGDFWGSHFGHLMQRADSLEETLMLGRIGGRRRRGQQRMRPPSSRAEGLLFLHGLESNPGQISK